MTKNKKGFKMADIEFFGEIDKTRDGAIASDMPAWFFREQVDELQESIAKKKRTLARGGSDLPEGHFFIIKNELKGMEARLEQIQKSKPKFQGSQKTMFANEYHKLQNRIADSMPTKLEDKEGYTDARDELARCKTPHIEVDPKIAQACGIKHVKGRVTGDGAAKMYKMIGRVLGENTNVEKIRKEGMSEAQRQMDDMTKLILTTFKPK